jgi:hypothetical protein
MTNAISRALDMAFAMGWEIFWPLILGLRCRLWCWPSYHIER